MCVRLVEETYLEDADRQTDRRAEGQSVEPTNRQTRRSFSKYGLTKRLAAFSARFNPLIRQLSFSHFWSAASFGKPGFSGGQRGMDGQMDGWMHKHLASQLLLLLPHVVRIFSKSPFTVDENYYPEKWRKYLGTKSKLYLWNGGSFLHFNKKRPIRSAVVLCRELIP